MFALMRKEELVHNPEDWAYKVAKNHKALQEGGTLRYCSTIITIYLSSIYPRWSKTADAQGQLYHVNQKRVDKNLRQFKLVRRK